MTTASKINLIDLAGSERASQVLNDQVIKTAETAALRLKVTTDTLHVYFWRILMFCMILYVLSFKGKMKLFPKVKLSYFLNIIAAIKSLEYLGVWQEELLLIKLT